MLVVMMMLCQLPDRKYDTVEEAVRGRGNTNFLSLVAEGTVSRLI